MMYSTLVLLIVIYCTNGVKGGLRIQGIEFDVIKDKRSVSNVTATYNALTVIECGIYCARVAGCSTMNFKRPDCQLLNETAGAEFQLVGDSRWRFVCKCG